MGAPAATKLISSSCSQGAALAAMTRLES